MKNITTEMMKKNDYHYLRSSNFFRLWDDVCPEWFAPRQVTNIEQIVRTIAERFQDSDEK